MCFCRRRGRRSRGDCAERGARRQRRRAGLPLWRGWRRVRAPGPRRPPRLGRPWRRFSSRPRPATAKRAGQRRGPRRRCLSVSRPNTSHVAWRRLLRHSGRRLAQALQPARAPLRAYRRSAVHQGMRRAARRLAPGSQRLSGSVRRRRVRTALRQVRSAPGKCCTCKSTVYRSAPQAVSACKASTCRCTATGSPADGARSLAATACADLLCLCVLLPAPLAMCAAPKPASEAVIAARG